MTAMVLKLIHGAAQLNLMSGRYRVSDGFVPPSVRVVPQLANGTSANRTGGRTKTGQSAVDRDWSFPVSIVNCASEAETRAAANTLQAFLDLGGDLDTPLYLYFKPNSDTTLDPLWGQAGYFYEIQQGVAMLPNGLYAVGDLRFSHLPLCQVSLTIKPYVQGQPQLLANATGGLLSDQWGTPDGSERGLIIPGATGAGGNKMTNPVFGHATWNNNWTAAANVIASQNTNPNYLLPQTQNSALLQSVGSSANFTQSINVGGTTTHGFSALVMRPDGGAVTSADCLIFYGVSQTTTFRNLGDGLWLATASAAGINAGTATGLQVVSGHSVYLLAFQTENLATNGFISNICWGDLLGCAWTGTAHASTSTRTAAACKVAIDDTVLRAAQGSIALTWIAPLAQGTYPASDFTFFDSRDGSGGAGALIFYYHGAGPTLVFGNTTTTAAAAAAWSAGDVITFHLTWGPTGGMIIYKNGTVFATQASFTVGALAASLFIGSIFNSTQQIGGTFADFRTYPHEMTAAEVTADYNNVSKVSGATADVCQRVGAIPWLYTSAGDGLVGAVDGNVSSVRKYNWAVAGGIPGSAPAIVELKLTHSTGVSFFGKLWISRLRANYFRSPTTLFYTDFSGTADSGASSGDAYQSQSVNTSEVDWNAANYDAPTYALLQGREFYLFTRLKDAGANMTIAIGFNFGGVSYVTDYTALSTFVAFYLYQTKPLIFTRLENIFTGHQLAAIQLWLASKRSSAGAANLSVDFFAVMVRPLTGLNFISSTGTGTVLHLKNRDLAAEDTGTITDRGNVDGDAFELDPGAYNILYHLLSNQLPGSGGVYLVTYTLTYTSVWVTPRYSLI